MPDYSGIVGDEPEAKSILIILKIFVYLRCVHVPVPTHVPHMYLEAGGTHMLFLGMLSIHFEPGLLIDSQFTI